MIKREEERQRARDAHSQIYRRLVKFEHHYFSHGEAVRVVGAEGRMLRPLTEAEETDPAIVAEAVEFYELVSRWADAGLRYAALRGKAAPNAVQTALQPRSATEDEGEGIAF